MLTWIYLKNRCIEDTLVESWLWDSIVRYQVRSATETELPGSRSLWLYICHPAKSYACPGYKMLFHLFMALSRGLIFSHLQAQAESPT